MKRKVVWLVVTGWLVAALLLASCAPAAVKEEAAKVAPPKEKEEVVAPKEGVVPKEVKEEVERPRYGGVLTMARSSDVNAGWTYTGGLVSAQSYGDWWHLRGAILEGFLQYDPFKGPRGTKEWGFEPQPDPNPLVQRGWLTESWEVVEPDTVKFKMRDGIYWQDGSKVTAEDVVYTFRLLYGGLHVKSPWATTRPYIRDLKEPQKSVYLDPADPTGRTVVFVAAPGKLGEMWVLVFGYWGLIYPRSLGNRDGFGTWQDVFGTGPYVITDYVASSSLTFGRAPNYTYWQSDPFYPENQLPYPDGFRWLVIPDLSTRLAALRTGKTDIMEAVGADTAESLWATNPELKWRETPSGSGPVLALRHDVAPFSDVRVRRALMMAINQDEMVQYLYDGKATKFYWPTFPGQPMNIYVPIEKMPQDVQELYEYHPDKARQLLAEAGYPNGFKVSVDVASNNNQGLDALQVIQEYLAKVKVELSITVRDPGVFSAIQRNRTHKQATMTGVSGYNPYNWFNTQPAAVIGNPALINEPLANKYAETQFQNFVTNPAEWVRMWPQITTDLQRLALYIQTPLPKEYTFWQPWVKEYYGEMYPNPGPANFQDLAVRGLWIDQALKKTMGR